MSPRGAVSIISCNAGRSKTDAISGNNGAGKQRSPVVRALPPFAADQRDRNSDKRGDRRQRIGAMMPGIRLNRGAFDIAADSVDVAKQNLFYEDNDDQNRERERRWTVMRRKNFTHTLDRQASRGHEDTAGDDDGCDRFGFAVTVGMSRVRRTRGKLQPAPNDKRTGNIERRFNTIGDQDVSIAEKTAQNFCRRKNQVDQHPNERNARARLQIAGRIGRCRMRRSHQ